MGKTASKPKPRSLFRDQRKSEVGDYYARDQMFIHFDYAENLYKQWPKPTCIISDGPYGVSRFPGDNHKAESLAEWYQPHIRAWSKHATAQTTLWIWNTEVGWATMHPVLVANGWKYRCFNNWDKGPSHVAGNANTQTLRKFPVVTEIFMHYVNVPIFQMDGQPLTMQQWFHYEWKRMGLAFQLANQACEVLNAATRKTSRQIISGITRRWAKFNCNMGVSNVWRKP